MYFRQTQSSRQCEWNRIKHSYGTTIEPSSAITRNKNRRNISTQLIPLSVYGGSSLSKNTDHDTKNNLKAQKKRGIVKKNYSNVINSPINRQKLKMALNSAANSIR